MSVSSSGVKPTKRTANRQCRCHIEPFPSTSIPFRGTRRGDAANWKLNYTTQKPNGAAPIVSVPRFEALVRLKETPEPPEVCALSIHCSLYLVYVPRLNR